MLKLLKNVIQMMAKIRMAFAKVYKRRLKTAEAYVMLEVKMFMITVNE